MHDYLVWGAVCLVAGGTMLAAAFIAGVIEMRREREADAEESRLRDQFHRGNPRVFLDLDAPEDFGYVHTDTGRYLVGDPINDPMGLRRDMYGRSPGFPSRYLR